MPATGSEERLGIRPFDEFEEANALWPRGDRLDAMRAAAARFRERFKDQGQVTAVRTLDLGSRAYPTRFALAGAARGLNPYVTVVNRLIVVQFRDFAGELRTLAWRPSPPQGSTPFYEQLAERYGERVSTRVFSASHHTTEEALRLCGLDPGGVDYVAFDHLQGQDLRLLLGTTKPIGGEPEPRPPLFPNAVLVCQSKELDTLRSVHPMQWAWYVPGGMEEVVEDRLLLVDGDVELGTGVALVATPGHTDGNQSLCLNAPDGVWVSSENGVAADSWHPHLSKIPGLRSYAELWRREVILNSNTLEDSVDQYDSMVKEKALADANRLDPRWLNVLPSSEMASLRRHWPVVPSFVYGGIDFGRLEETQAPASNTARRDGPAAHDGQ